jgi:hypothetical protein
VGMKTKEKISTPRNANAMIIIDLMLKNHIMRVVSYSYRQSLGSRNGFRCCHRGRLGYRRQSLGR